MSEQQQLLALPADTVVKPTHHELGCGCQVELDRDVPTWVVVQCAEHSTASAHLEYRIGRLLDAELDDVIRELAGRAPTRIERKAGAVGTFAVARPTP